MNRKDLNIRWKLNDGKMENSNKQWDDVMITEYIDYLRYYVHMRGWLDIRLSGMSGSNLVPITPIFT